MIRQAYELKEKFSWSRREPLQRMIGDIEHMLMAGRFEVADTDSWFYNYLLRLMIRDDRFT